MRYDNKARAMIRRRNERIAISHRVFHNYRHRSGERYKVDRRERRAFLYSSETRKRFTRTELGPVNGIVLFHLEAFRTRSVNRPSGFIRMVQSNMRAATAMRYLLAVL
jgi:hypothetical protein